jgi:hypothetical protein
MSKIRFVDLSVHVNTIAVAQRVGEIRMASFRNAQRLPDGGKRQREDTARRSIGDAGQSLR